MLGRVDHQCGIGDARGRRGQLDYNLLFRWLVGLGIDDPTPAARTAEGDAAPTMIGRQTGRHRATLGADKRYDPALERRKR